MILVDVPSWPWRGRLYSHLVSDTELGELHAIAARAGIHPRAFDGDHYDIPEERYAAVVAAGAVPVDGHELVIRLNASGLRVRKRRGEKLLDSVPNGCSMATARHRLDVVRSPLAPPATATVAVAVFVGDGAGRWLLVHASRDAWRPPGTWLESNEPPVEAAHRAVGAQTGLQLPAEGLTACGYERITFEGAPAAGPWEQVSHVAIFAATVGSAWALTSTVPGGNETAWFGSSQLARRCDAQPWWPLLAAHAGLDLPAPAWAMP